jgi:hypothetical protein
LNVSGENDNKIEIGFTSSSQYNGAKNVDIVFNPVNVINNDIIHDLAFFDFNNAFYYAGIDRCSNYPKLKE